MIKIEHIGIAVRNLKHSEDLFARLLGAPKYKTEVVDSEKVSTSFFQLGETKIELLESTDGEGSVSKFIEKRGEGVHHIAIAVADIRQEISRLRAQGFDFIAEEPKTGADQKLICFLHPKSTNGVLIELCQEIS